MELDSCNLSGALNFVVVPRCLENVCTSGVCIKYCTLTLVIAKEEEGEVPAIVLLAA
jgi:hypothetical protein